MKFSMAEFLGKLKILNHFLKMSKNKYFIFLREPITFPNKPVRSDGVKELITKMLQIEETNRISWVEVFENQILKK